MIESSFQNSDGLTLFMRSWPAENAKAAVAIVPGFNSHSGYYEWTAAQLNANGISAYAIDLRGRGRSDGERFFVGEFTDYVNDAAEFMERVSADTSGLPVFLLGHSAGGVVACLYTLDHQPELAGFICESFAFRVPAPDFALAALKGLSHVFPHAHVLKLKNKFFTRDAAALEEMNNDPLIENETQPTSTIAAMVRADAKLEEVFSKFTLPLLILHGTEDQATRWQGSQMFYDNASSTDKTLKLYEGHYHDLLNDTGKDEVMADIVEWIAAKG